MSEAPAKPSAADLDKLTAKHTAFATFAALLEANRARRYIPTIRLDLTGNRAGITLAAAFNEEVAPLTDRMAHVWHATRGTLPHKTVAEWAARIAKREEARRPVAA